MNARINRMNYFPKHVNYDGIYYWKAGHNNKFNIKEVIVKSQKFKKAFYRIERLEGDEDCDRKLNVLLILWGHAKLN